MPQHDPHTAVNFRPDRSWEPVFKFGQVFNAQATPCSVVVKADLPSPAAKINPGGAMQTYQGVIPAVQPASSGPADRIQATPDWALALFIGGIGVIAWKRINFPRKFRLMFSTFISNRLVRQAMREESFLSHSSSWALLFLFVLSSGMILFQMHHHGMVCLDFSGHHGILLYLELCGMVLGIYILKVLGVICMQFILTEESVLPEYLFNVLLFNKVLAFIFLPLSIAIAYMHPVITEALIWAGISVFGAFWFYRLIRGLITGVGARVSFLYLILYLCTFEILPLIALSKVMGGRISCFS